MKYSSSGAVFLLDKDPLFALLLVTALDFAPTGARSEIKTR
jgi:hypothetical protein